jgi:glucose/arabinose dehydrogenase
MVPGTNMVIAVPDAKDRADVIAYLGTLRAITASTADRGAPAAHHEKTNGDWENDAPGAKHRVAIDQLPAPYATKSVGNNPRVSDRPANAALSVPKGFEIKQFATGLKGPRLMRTAPNGDIFIAETREGQIRVLRAPAGADAPTENSVYATGLRGPFGVAFYPTEGEPRYIYVGNLNNVVRFAYKSGDLKASGPAEVVVPHLSGTTGGHSTRDVAFSLDGKKLYISVGSGSNVADDYAGTKKTAAEIKAWEANRPQGAAWGSEENRADVLVADPDGKNVRIFATGIRNAVGLAVQPEKGELWVSTNERDGLGDDLVPDYISHVKEGGYYGWPWYYWGNHEDPRRAGERPDLAGKAIVPDVPIQAHSASLQMTFYPAKVSGPAAFPKDYNGDIFAALHGSWNRTGRTGSKVIRIHLKDGIATGEYEDFLTGFVIDDGHVWGRPVGVTVAQDGALLVTEDAGSTVWRVTYKGHGQAN